MQLMTPTVTGLLSIAAALQIASVSLQILMQRRGVGFLLRSPFGTVLNVLASWLSRRGSSHPRLNRLRQKRWVAAEVSRAVVCGYFEYPTMVKLSLKDILMLVLYLFSYGAYKLAFGPNGGIVEWFVLVSIIVVAYYGIVTLWILADLVFREASRRRLSYIIGTMFSTRAYCSSYMSELVATGILPAALVSPAQETHGIGWWAKRYWGAETHREKDIVLEIIQRTLEYEKTKVAVREQERHPSRAGGTAASLGDARVDSLEDVLSPLDSQFARRLRIEDAEFRIMLVCYDTYPDGSRGQRRQLKKIVDHLRQQMTVEE
jgi:hypothetical protein